MPEIKNQFTGGKMNKDVDERLVPKGEYRDAMNIQVSTSEGSDVGTVQNILGNALVSDQSFIQPGAFCVGSIADEKNDKAYFFIRTSFTSGLINIIIELDSATNSIVPVLAVSNDVLEFTQDRLITGINILTTYSIVTFAWIFFRSESTGHAFDYILQLIQNIDFPDVKRFGLLFVFGLLFLELLVFKDERNIIFSKIKLLNNVIYLALIYLTLANSINDSEFIYFQF